MIVLDTSLIGPFAIPDEAGDLDADAFDTLSRTPIIVPGHWRLEVANMLRTAVRRSRLQADSRAEIFGLLDSFLLTVDRHTWDHAWTATVALSDRYGLTPYDAAYLELAKRVGAPLATRDCALAQAARGENISILDFRP